MPLYRVLLKYISNLYYLGDELQSCRIVFNRKGRFTVKAYIRSITRKAWWLIWCSVFYLLLTWLLTNWMKFTDALFFAQAVYVFIIALPLIIPSLGEKVFLRERTAEDKERIAILYLQATIASFRRFLADRRVRPSVPEAKSDDPVDPDLAPGKRGDL